MRSNRNVLFIHSDEHSFRFVSARTRDRGGEPCDTPTIDGLIHRGAYFETAYCQSPLCTPSRIAMLTGRHPHLCGAWWNGAVLRPDLPTFGGHLRAHGYETVAIGKMHIGGSCQYAGFGARPYGDFGGPCGHQPDPISEAGDAVASGREMRARTEHSGVTDIPESMLQESVVVRETLAFLRELRHRDPGRPWLAYASFGRPHFPLTAPRRFVERYSSGGTTPPFVPPGGDAADHPLAVAAMAGSRAHEVDVLETQRARAAYFASVDYVDEIIGDLLVLLERDGFLDDTVVVYASDHGEIAGEHGLWWKHTWHEAATRVPLVVSLPEHREQTTPPVVIREPVSLGDLFPTLCGLTGIEPPEGLTGIDLTPAIRGEDCPPLRTRPGVVVESLNSRWGAGTEFRMIRTARHKYIAFHGCADLAFDLVADPGEQHDLLRATPPIELDLASLRDHAIGGFNFEQAIEQREADQAELATRYARRVFPRTANQIWLGNGMLVEADTAISEPELVSDDPVTDFDDYPAR